MSYGSQTRNPAEHDDRDGLDRDDDAPAICHGCDGYLPADPTQWRLFGGWHYCLDCFAVLAGEDRDDEFNKVRR